jgi:hypothetical protein
MTVKYSDLREDMKIEVRTYTGELHIGTIVELERDIKNGFPGANYDLDNGEGYWCYVDQITRIL